MEVKSQKSKVKSKNSSKSQIPNPKFSTSSNTKNLTLRATPLQRGNREALFSNRCLGFGALLLTVLWLMVWGGVAQAEVISSTELIELPKKYDGKTVTFRGEVVGDVMIRGDFAWINVNDDPYRPPKVVKKQKLAGYNQGQSIWIREEEAKKIAHKGDYKHAGDIVEVVGTFNRACVEHGGDMDVHGKGFIIVKRGYLVKRPLEWPKGLAALGLFLLALILFQANRTFQKRLSGI